MFIPPYSLIRSYLSAEENAQAPIRSERYDDIIDFLLRRLLRDVTIDEQRYLQDNPDVAAAVADGRVSSARDHFVLRGYFEGRVGRTLEVDESWYLEQYPDVANAIGRGAEISASEHYYGPGIREWRVPNREVAPDVSAWRGMLSIPNRGSDEPAGTVGATDGIANRGAPPKGGAPRSKANLGRIFRKL